jgi:meiotically up-regulated gene 157 (Mug157) protein
MAVGQTVLFPSKRPQPSNRKFQSAAVEAFLLETNRQIADPELAAMFTNCFPNTLDTTVEVGEFEGKPDTAVITGDIPAMWLRDSSAQVWPYLPLAAKDASLRRLLEGVIRRQTRCLLIDPYANAFMADLNAPPLEWSVKDKTEMKPGVGERKYELDSLCYPIRLAHGYWKATGDTSPFDTGWKKAMQVILQTMRVQQRKEGPDRFVFSGVGRRVHLPVPGAVESVRCHFSATAGRDGNDNFERRRHGCGGALAREGGGDGASSIRHCGHGGRLDLGV